MPTGPEPLEASPPVMVALAVVSAVQFSGWPRAILARKMTISMSYAGPLAAEPAGAALGAAVVEGRAVVAAGGWVAAEGAGDEVARDGVEGAGGEGAA